MFSTPETQANIAAIIALSKRTYYEIIENKYSILGCWMYPSGLNAYTLIFHREIGNHTTMLSYTVRPTSSIIMRAA